MLILLTILERKRHTLDGIINVNESSRLPPTAIDGHWIIIGDLGAKPI